MFSPPTTAASSCPTYQFGYKWDERQRVQPTERGEEHVYSVASESEVVQEELAKGVTVQLGQPPHEAQGNGGVALRCTVVDRQSVQGTTVWR